MQPQWKAVWQYLKKIKNGTTFWPSYPISGNISEGTQNTNLKEHKHCYVHCSVIYNLHNLEAAQVSINRWVDKTTMGHLHHGILLCRKKKKKICTLCNTMDGCGEHYAKWNKSVKERQIPWFHSYVESNEQTELTSKIKTDSWTESRMTATVGKVRGWMDWAKRKKDSWTWTTVWWLLGTGGYKETHW